MLRSQQKKKVNPKKSLKHKRKHKHKSQNPNSTDKEKPQVGIAPSRVTHGYRDDPNDSVLSVKIPRRLLEALEIFLDDTKKARLSNGIKHNGFKTTYIRRLLTKELGQYDYYVEED